MPPETRPMARVSRRLGRSPKAKRAVSQLKTSSTCPTALTWATGTRVKAANQPSEASMPAAPIGAAVGQCRSTAREALGRADAEPGAHQECLRQRHGGEGESGADQEAVGLEREAGGPVGDAGEREAGAARQPQPGGAVEDAARQAPIAGEKHDAEKADEDAEKRQGGDGVPEQHEAEQRRLHGLGLGEGVADGEIPEREHLKKQQRRGDLRHCPDEPPGREGGRRPWQGRAAPDERRHQEDRPGHRIEEARVGGAQDPALKVSDLCSAVRRFCRKALASEKATQSSMPA